jgi:glycerol-3-phosphate acyltransferase PlsY
MPWIIGVLLSYCLGAIPFGYLAVLLVARKDIRSVGSGNIGATNVYRVLGIHWAVLVFILDCLKGILAVSVIPAFLQRSETSYILICGLASVLGHMFTFFLRFKGGKGVAVAVGVVIGLGFSQPLFLLILCIALLVWVILFRVFHYVSLASVVAALLFFMLSILFPLDIEYKLFAFLAMAGIVVRHRQNIQRLIQKKELKC